MMASMTVPIMHAGQGCRMDAIMGAIMDAPPPSIFVARASRIEPHCCCCTTQDKPACLPARPCSDAGPAAAWVWLLEPRAPGRRAAGRARPCGTCTLRASGPCCTPPPRRMWPWEVPFAGAATVGVEEACACVRFGTKPEQPVDGAHGRAPERQHVHACTRRARWLRRARRCSP